MRRAALIALLAVAGVAAHAQGPTTDLPAAPATTPGEPPVLAPSPPAVSAPETPASASLLPPPPAAPPVAVLPPLQPPHLVLPPSAKPPRTAARPPKARPKPPHVSVTAVLYGRSVFGRRLNAWVLDCGPRPTANTTLVFGGFHGDERSTPALVAQFRRYLGQNAKQWRGRVVIVPCANPDGWSAGTRVNARGVDLNRNFPAGWQSAGPAARYRPGPAPASEPETRAMMALIRRFQPAKIISVHSPLHCLNPTGTLGFAVAQAMHHRNGYPVRGYIGYPTPGSLGEYGGALGIGVVTLELPVQSAPAAWAANRDALLAAVTYRPPSRVGRR